MQLLYFDTPIRKKLQSIQLMVFTCREAELAGRGYTVMVLYILTGSLHFLQCTSYYCLSLFAVSWDSRVKQILTAYLNTVRSGCCGTIQTITKVMMTVFVTSSFSNRIYLRLDLLYGVIHVGTQMSVLKNKYFK